MKKPDAKVQSIYLTHVLEGIENKRQISINEMNKSGLSTKNQLVEINEWYQTIVKLICENPPVHYAKSIKLYQNLSGRIFKIDYQYIRKTIEIDNIEFVIILWNDIDQ